MEQALDQNQAPQPKPKRRRWIRRIFLGTFLTLLLLFVAGGTLWYLGIPQQAALGYVSRLVGAEITIDTIHLGSSVVLSGIAVHDAPAEPPPFRLGLLELAYEPFPEDGRYLRKLDLRGPEIDLQRQPDGGTNYDFLLDLLKAPRGGRGGGGSAWLPKEITASEAGLHFETPNGAVRLGPLEAVANFAAADAFSVRLGGNVDIEATRAGSVIIDEEGDLTAKIERAEDEYAVRAHADLPALAELETEGTFSRRDEGWYADVRVDALTLAPAAAGGVLATFLPAPLQFDRLELTDSYFQGLIALDSMAVPNAQVNLAAQGLVAGPAGAPWYSGDLQVKGTSSAEGDALTLSAKLARGQQVEATVSGGLDEGKATLTFAGWSEPDLESMIPVAYREAIAPRLHLRELKTAAAVGWKDQAYTAEAHLDVVTSAGTPAVVQVAGSGPLGDTAGVELFAGPVSVSLGDQKVAGELKVAQDRSVVFAGTAEQVDPSTWLQAWLDATTLKDLAAPLSGTVGIEYVAESDALPITADVSAPAFRYSSGAVTIAAPLAAKGTLVYHTEAKNVTADRIAAHFGGDNAATFSKLEVDLTPFAFRANVEGDTALDLVGGWFGFKDLFGQAHFSGPVRYRGNEVSAEFKIAADPLGYGDLVAPYGTPVTAEGTLAMNLDTKAGSLKPLSLAIGEDTQIVSTGFDLKVSPFSLEGPVEITTDFYPVVALGMLEGFTGTGSFTGPLAVKEGGVQFDFASELSAQEILLPSRILALLDAAFTGQVRRGAEGLGGEGSLRVGQTMIAGAAIAEAAGPVRFEGENVVLENLEGKVFGGTVRMTAVLGVLAEGRPIRLQGALSGIDLAAFTAEVKPPQVVLTGIASGNFTVAFTNGEISELQLTLESNEGFSMNKDAVARVLMEQQLIDMTGGKQMQKIVEDVLGKSEQRPFERAKVDLTLREGRVVGPAELESKGLNLTVDILADWSAIMEGLKIRQRDLS